VNCREAERLIDTFYDGELDGRSMRDAALHITRCKRCEAELNQREQLQRVVSTAIEAEIADLDLSRIWAAVEPTLESASARTLPSLRVAASSTRVGGLLLGRTRPPEQRDELDPETWDAPRASGGQAWRWSLAGGAALAASVLLAIALVPGQSPNVQTAEQAAATEVARVPAPPQAVAQRPALPVGSVPFDVARAGFARAPRITNKQVQVESVNFPRSSVAMWSEPATDTTVIWIEDEELAASGRR
jgi:hypothetical protein